MRISDWSSDVCSSDLVGVAEGRALPAAEGVESQRHRDRHVDSDHADLHFGGEVAGGLAVAVEDRHAIAELMPGWQLRRFLDAVSPHHAQNRAATLFHVDFHRRLADVETI